MHKHIIHKFRVVLGAHEHIQKLFGGVGVVARYHAAYCEYAFEFLLGKQQVFPSGAGTVEVDCGEDAAFGKFAVEVDFHIARTLEFFVNDVVHARAGINERGGDYGERTAVFYISRTTEEPLGGVERAGIDTAGRGSVLRLAWGDSSLSWYVDGYANGGSVSSSKSAKGQLNEDGVTYTYLALCEGA